MSLPRCPFAGGRPDRVRACSGFAEAAVLGGEPLYNLRQYAPPSCSQPLLSCRHLQGGRDTRGFYPACHHRGGLPADALRRAAQSVP